MFPEIHWIATLVAFASNFVVGGAWYGIFARPWMREVGLTEAELKGGEWPMPSYLIAVLGSAVQAFVMALVVGWARPGLGGALLMGVLLGLAAAFATGKHHAFSKKTWALFAIDGGSDLAAFAAMGLVFGLMT